MASYTITTTPDQDAVLQFVVTQANQQRETAMTVGEYITQRFLDLLAPFATQYQKSLATQLTTKFAQADAATKQQVLVLLKVTP